MHQFLFDSVCVNEELVVLSHMVFVRLLVLSTLRRLCDVTICFYLFDFVYSSFKHNVDGSSKEKSHVRCSLQSLA